MNPIEYKKLDFGDNPYEIIINGSDGGLLIIDDAGFYNWLPPSGLHGYIPTWVLQNIVDKLNELNKDWQDEIEREHKN